MNKIIKEQIAQLKPSATLAINEESNKLKKSGKKAWQGGEDMRQYAHEF